MRSMLKSVSTFLFALSLALGVLALAATNTMAAYTGPCAKLKDQAGGFWYCAGTCPGELFCQHVTQGAGWICDCR